MKKKGFTLIELLAVIIVLAVIALIATPIVLNVVDNAKKNANRNSAYGLIDAARFYYAESLLDASKQANINGTTNVINEINVSGDRPDSGYIYINSKGEISLAVIYDNVCFVKEYLDDDLSEKSKEDCKTKEQSSVTPPSSEIIYYNLTGNLFISDSNRDAVIVVFSDTPHYSVLDENGNFEVTGLEPGNHELFILIDMNLEDVKSMNKAQIENNMIGMFEFNTDTGVEEMPWQLDDFYMGIKNCNLTKIKIPVIENSKGLKLTDNNSNGNADIGELISIGTESFYVISNDGNNIKALAQYNLKVGVIVENALNNNYEISKSEPGYGLQDSTMKGYCGKDCYPYNGTIWIQEYSDVYNWGKEENYNIQKYDNPIKTAINNYKTILYNLGLDCKNIELIKMSELEALKCDKNNRTCVDSPYSWIYSSSYWTESQIPNLIGGTWYVRITGELSTIAPYYYTYAGVRPVITIEKDLFNK